MSLADAAEAWSVLGIVVFAVLASEGLCYLFVYRKPEYRRACERLKDLTKKFEKEEIKIVPVDKRKAHERAVARLEEDVKDATNKLSALKFRATILTSVGFFMLYRVVASSFSGRIVARLPFEPIKIVQNLTHRGLPEKSDIRDCGFGLIYTLATMALKQNVPRLFGFAPPRSAFDPSKAAARAAAKMDSESQRR